MKYRARGGGCATFAPEPGRNDGWREAHADSTIAVIEALRRTGALAHERKELIDWITRGRSEGRLRGYWWGTPGYLLWILSQAGMLHPQDLMMTSTLMKSACSVPELPMLLRVVGSAARFDVSVQAAAARLIRAQRADGSWACAPCLRLTSPTCDVRGGGVLSGPLYWGARRVFSTAHSVAALSMMRERRVR